MVVRRFWFRGAVNSTIYGGLVVRYPGSCLGILRSMGINDKDSGCKKWGKSGDIDKKGR